MGLFHESAKAGDLAAVQQAFNGADEEAAGDINARDNHYNTILHIACRYGKDTIVRWTIEKGAQINAQNLSGDTPLMIACQEGKFSLVRMLLDNHANCSLANEHGNTALHYACFFNHKNIATLIAERFYLTIAIPNKYDKTCLSFADDEMIAKLKDIISKNDKPELDQNDDVKSIARSSDARNQNETKMEAKLRFLAKTQQNVEISPLTLRIIQPLSQSKKALILKGTWQGSTVAIKKIKNQDLSPTDISVLRNEIKYIKRLFHTSLLFIFGVCLESPSIGLVTEYVSAADLGQFLSNADQKMEISLVSKFATEICSGMAFLHSQNPAVTHGDLRPSHILVTENLDLKIANYGLRDSVLAFKIQKSFFDVMYTAPEVLKQGGFGSNQPEETIKKADVYSFGMVLAHIVTRNLPFQIANVMKLGHKIVHDKLRPTFPDYIPENWVNLIKKLWPDNPRERPSFSEIMSQIPVVEDKKVTEIENEIQVKILKSLRLISGKGVDDAKQAFLSPLSATTFGLKNIVETIESEPKTIVSRSSMVKVAATTETNPELLSPAGSPILTSRTQMRKGVANTKAEMLRSVIGRKESDKKVSPLTETTSKDMLMEDLDKLVGELNSVTKNL